MCNFMGQLRTLLLLVLILASCNLKSRDSGTNNNFGLQEIKSDTLMTKGDEYGRSLTIDEKKQLNVTFQSGVELLGWIVKLEKELTNEILVIKLKEATDKIQKEGIKFPLDVYNEYRDVEMSFSIVFGQCIVDQFHWTWAFVERGDHLGWTIISPDHEYGIALEDYFFSKMVWDTSKPISCLEIYKKLERNDYKERNGVLKYLK